MMLLIPVYLGAGHTAAHWNDAFGVVQSFFANVGSVMFGETYLGYFALFLIVVGIAKLLWSIFKGV